MFFKTIILFAQQANIIYSIAEYLYGTLKFIPAKRVNDDKYFYWLHKVYCMVIQPDV
ncbi:hypothetical protein [Ferruginibacter profundus]